MKAAGAAAAAQKMETFRIRRGIWDTRHTSTSQTVTTAMSTEVTVIISSSSSSSIAYRHPIPGRSPEHNPPLLPLSSSPWVYMVPKWFICSCFYSCQLQIYSCGYCYGFRDSPEMPKTKKYIHIHSLLGTQWMVGNGIAAALLTESVFLDLKYRRT